jgi:hypothetical protein
MAVMRDLESEEIRPVKDQHVVSKVVLKGFASSLKSRQGVYLARFDKRQRRELDPKGLNACGKINGFVQYASGSAEALWHSVETKLSEAIKAAEAGTLHENEKHVEAIKDGIALHLVRTPRYRRVHEGSFLEAMRSLRIDLLENRREMVATEFRRLYGLEAAGQEALDLVISEHFKRWQELEESGALLRVALERGFHRTRIAISEANVEVLRVPRGKEMIISDAPAYTFAYTPTGVLDVNVTIGDSHGIALPITSRCSVVMGPESRDEVVSPEIVDRFNHMQVRVAERQIYCRPDSLAKRFIMETMEQMKEFD